MINVLYSPGTQSKDSLGAGADRLLQLKRHLSQMDINLQISSDLAVIRSEWVDIVHLFDLAEPESLLPRLDIARQQDLPIVLSPHYWSPYELLFESSNSIPLQLIRATLPKFTAMNFHEKVQRKKRRQSWQIELEVLRNCRFILPSSAAEQAQLIDEYGIELTERFAVIHSAISPDEVDSAGAEKFAAAYGLRDFVLCVGPFDERGNQLGLIRALRRTDIPIVFMGPVSARQDGYLGQCRQAARKLNGQVLFIPEKQNQSMIYSAMKNARVHVQPSWQENNVNTGLQAACCDCNLVITDRSPWREYFGDCCYVCDPASPESMRHAVLLAYAAEKTPELSETVHNRFTWEQMAAELAEVYRTVKRG